MENAATGSPSDWYGPSVLSASGLRRLDFDYFVNWPKNTLERFLWKKLVADADTWPPVLADVQQAIHACLGTEWVDLACSYRQRHGLEYAYMVFQDGPMWASLIQPDEVAHTQAGPMVVVELCDTSRARQWPISPELLIRRIVQRTGSAMRIGAKGLIYSTTQLEAELCRSAMWPGDLDRMLIDDSGDAVVLIEDKKNTKSSDLSDENVSKYMATDWRKYKRLQIASEQMEVGRQIPVVICYYGTQPGNAKIKLERVTGGPSGNLETVESSFVDAPNIKDPSTFSPVVRETVRLATS